MARPNANSGASGQPGLWMQRTTREKRLKPGSHQTDVHHAGGFSTSSDSVRIKKAPISMSHFGLGKAKRMPHAFRNSRKK